MKMKEVDQRVALEKICQEEDASVEEGMMFTGKATHSYHLTSS